MTPHPHTNRNVAMLTRPALHHPLGILMPFEHTWPPRMKPTPTMAEQRALQKWILTVTQGIAITVGSACVLALTGAAIYIAYTVPSEISDIKKVIVQAVAENAKQTKELEEVNDRVDNHDRRLIRLEGDK